MQLYGSGSYRIYGSGHYRSRDSVHAVHLAQLASTLTQPFRDWLYPTLCARPHTPHAMENLNMIYNVDYQLIVCIEHGYCVSVDTLKQHLSQLHRAKGERLRAALAEANALETKDPRQTHISLSTPDFDAAYLLASLAVPL